MAQRNGNILSRLRQERAHASRCGLFARVRENVMLFKQCARYVLGVRKKQVQQPTVKTLPTLEHRLF
jgi:hypothetical protein